MRQLVDAEGSILHGSLCQIQKKEKKVLWKLKKVFAVHTNVRKVCDHIVVIYWFLSRVGNFCYDVFVHECIKQIVVC